MTVKQNPCRYCCASFHDARTGRHVPSFFSDTCLRCEYRKNHETYLKSIRKYKPGARITNLEDLLKCRYVIWNNKTMHIEAIKSWQLRLVMKAVSEGWFMEAMENYV